MTNRPVWRRAAGTACRSGGGSAPSAAEEAGPEAAVLQGVQLGFEPDAVLGEGGLLFGELGVLLDEAASILFEPLLLLFEGGDGLLLELALELDEVQALYLGPEAVYLHARSVALLADLLDLAAPLLEAGLVVLAPLPEALVALGGGGGGGGGGG